MAPMNRHSVIVWWVKVILPIVGILLLASLFLFSRSPNPDAALPFADVDVARIAADQRLSQPRFAGTLEDGRGVTLISDTATPSSERDTFIHLDTVEARVELSDDAFLLLDALSGTLDLGERVADLAGDVDIRTTQGYRVSSDAMQVAMDQLHLVSPGPVAASGPDFTLQAGSMEVFDPGTGAVLSFAGGVRLLYGTGN